jgi:hypothetical protein
MQQVQFISITPEQLQNAIIKGVKLQLEELKKSFQPKEPNKYITRQQVAEMLSVDLSTVHNFSVRGTIQKYQIGGRVLYKLTEVEEAIIKLNN